MRYIIVIILLFSGCRQDQFEKKPIIGRFDVIEQFYVFDGVEFDGSVDSPIGKIIKDRETGQCFLYIWGGADNGGPALALVPCR